METTPLVSRFAVLASEQFGRGAPWWRAYRRPGIRRRVARLDRARAVLSTSMVFDPWNPALTVWAGEMHEGKFVDPWIRCADCGGLDHVRVIDADPVLVANAAVLVGRAHRVRCGRVPFDSVPRQEGPRP